MKDLELAPELSAEGLVEAKWINDGPQAIYRFANGFGASVIKNSYSYGGMWELAVLKWIDGKSHLVYDTEITDDVVGYLEIGDVQPLLDRIKALDAKGREQRQEPNDTVRRAYRLAKEYMQALENERDLVAQRIRSTQAELDEFEKTYDLEGN